MRVVQGNCPRLCNQNTIHWRKSSGCKRESLVTYRGQGVAWHKRGWGCGCRSQHRRNRKWPAPLREAFGSWSRCWFLYRSSPSGSHHDQPLSAQLLHNTAIKQFQALVGVCLHRTGTTPPTNHTQYLNSHLISNIPTYASYVILLILSTGNLTAEFTQWLFNNSSLNHA